MSRIDEISAMPLDRQEVAALVLLFKAGAECAQKWGWNEERFVCLARVCWHWVATGKIEEPAARIDGGAR